MSTPEASSALCDQADCPIATEGRCLEGFPSGSGCPHLESEKLAEPVSPNGSSDEELEPDATDEDVEEWILLEGGESLTSAEAHEVAAEYGAEVILLAGEFESGKTTLIVELYGRFLHGPFSGWQFAGSKTLVALDKRHLPTRYASGNPAATTDRTRPEHEGLIHIRLAKHGRSVPLFFTDLRGERFEHVTDGVAASDEVPFAGRADLTLVLVDGEKVADLALRQGAMHRARQLIGGLTETGGVKPSRPMAVVLTKRDLLNDDQLEWFAQQAEPLAEFAAARGALSSVMTIAARPAATPDVTGPLSSVHLL